MCVCSSQDAADRRPASGEVVCGVSAYEPNETHEICRTIPDLNSFLSSISYRCPTKRSTE
jgi:hypothetical protein